MEHYEDIKDKKFKVGFYGGKFIPLHKGHEYCIACASKQCEKVYVILFYGGDDELKIIKTLSDEDKKLFSLDNRLKALKNLCNKYNNIEIGLIDVTTLKKEDGSEDWDAETPLVLNITGKMDAVYSSEVSYNDYFNEAYPWATHVLVDPPRIIYPISATKIRNMKNMEERNKWICN